jgi:5-methyltetrahydrofolate--homocysteine methyltransferase
MERWQGKVLVTMPDLGGNLDILQTFLTAQQLLLELYDNPEEVQRLIVREHALWHRCYEEINSVLQPVNPGYSDWSCIYSDLPTYILQCDFCYMIGPDMFREFVKPEMEATCARLPRSFYHLDGIGQLPHLDDILSIDNLDGVQWICGAGHGPEEAWPDVRRKIGDSGKKAQTFSTLDALATIIEQAGTSRGIHHRAYWPDPFDVDGAKRRLADFGIE